jgi:hypothetical protein
MDDDKHDDATSPSGSSRKRAAPTIDLTASSVSDSAATPSDAGVTSAPDSKPRKSWRDRFAGVRSAVTPSFRWPSFSGVKTPRPARAALSSMFVPGITGAVAALLVLGAYWWWDSSGGSSRILSRLPTSTAKSDRDSPGKQIVKVEPRAAPATATTPQNAALASRIDALDKSVAALRDDVAAARASIDELKAASASQAPDLSAVEERISKIERATVALTGEIAAPQKSTTDDPRLRRVTIAATLDAAVNRGEPYAVALSAAKAASEDASTLKPLDEFADKGIPSASALSRELIALLPQILPKTSSSQPTGLLDRLQQSAAKMIRIRRVDDDATTAIAAKAESAARRDDLAAARREVESLSGSSRAPIASWIEKVDAREAALAASRQFASSAAAALPKPAQ